MFRTRYGTSVAEYLVPKAGTEAEAPSCGCERAMVLCPRITQGQKLTRKALERLKVKLAPAASRYQN